MVQYFQRARLEYFPNAPEEPVRRSPLGKWLFQPSETVVDKYPQQTGACQFFSESGHYVCFEFLDFLKQDGYQALFGAPVSDMLKEQARTVQYFEYGRLEWHPENPSGKRVVISDVGTDYFSRSGEEPSRLCSTEAVFDPSPVEEKMQRIRTNAFPVKETLANIHQTQDVYSLYVIVKDQNEAPVPGASVTYSVIQDGQVEVNKIPLPTNEEGFTSTTFNIDASKAYEMVKVTVKVKSGELTSQTETAFWSGN